MHSIHCFFLFVFSSPFLFVHLLQVPNDKPKPSMQLACVSDVMQGDDAQLQSSMLDDLIRLSSDTYMSADELTVSDECIGGFIHSSFG